MQHDTLTAAIVDQALQLSPEERDAYISGVCAARPELKATIEHLFPAAAPTKRTDGLHTVQEAPEAERRPHGTTFKEIDAPIEEGTCIGPYKLLQELGAGGMGVVYMAEQQYPVKRKVALKIIKPGMDTRQVLARFETERQALAMMDHPNIAKVLDAGMVGGKSKSQKTNLKQTRSSKIQNKAADGPDLEIEDLELVCDLGFDACDFSPGRPYFVMELVKGVPITEFCDMAKLTPRERLELFIPVCRAVQHAHQKGIIHRDLKPLNVLVALQDGRPVPKVIDFGVAKAIHQRLTEKTLFTRINQPIGTPAYMSPEQAEMSGLDIDTRSDIYSLGVLLYELLTGTTPFEPARLRSAGYDEMQRILREEEPPAPSTRLSTLADGQLTEVAAHQRVPPTRLTALLRGELDWIVMKALEKERSRRYETADAFAQDIENYLNSELVTARPPSRAYRLAKFVRRHRVGLATAAMLAGLLVIGTAVSTWQAVRASRAERVTKAALADVEEQRDAARQAERSAEAVSEFLVETLRSPDPELDGREVTVAERLDDAADALADRFQDAPLIKARLLSVLGTTYNALGLPEQAIPLLVEAQGIWRQQRAADRRDALVARSTLAGAYYAAGQLDVAARLYDETLRKMKAAFGAHDLYAAGTLRGLADNLLSAGRVQEAIELYQDVLAVQRQNLSPDDLQTLTTEVNLAYAHKVAGDNDYAIKGLQSALERLRKPLRPNHPRILATMNLLANAYLAAGRTDQAVALLEETLRQRQQELGANHLHTLATAGGLAQAYRRAGRTKDAIALYDQTLQQLQEAGRGEHPRTLVLMNSLAVAHGHHGNPSQGVAILEDALEKMQRALPADHRERIIAAGNLAHLFSIAGDTQKAISFQRQYLDDCQRVFGDAHTRTLTAAVRLVELHMSAAAHAEAVAVAEEWTGLFRNDAVDRPVWAAFQSAYAAALLAQQKHVEAQALLDEAFRTAQESQVEAWQMGHLQCLLGTALCGAQQYKEAESALVAGFRALRKEEDRIPSQHKRVIRDAAAALARLYESWARPGDDERARQFRLLATGASPTP